MKALNNTKKTRFKIAVYSLGGLFLALFYSIFKEQTEVAVAITVPISSAIAIYGWGETKRKSNATDLAD